MVYGMGCMVPSIWRMVAVWWLYGGCGRLELVSSVMPCVPLRLIGADLLPIPLQATPTRPYESCTDAINVHNTHNAVIVFLHYTPQSQGSDLSRYASSI